MWKNLLQSVVLPPSLLLIVVWAESGHSRVNLRSHCRDKFKENDVKISRGPEEQEGKLDEQTVESV